MNEMNFSIFFKLRFFGIYLWLVFCQKKIRFFENMHLLQPQTELNVSRLIFCGGQSMRDSSDVAFLQVLYQLTSFIEASSCVSHQTPTGSSCVCGVAFSIKGGVRGHLNAATARTDIRKRCRAAHLQYGKFRITIILIIGVFFI